MTSRGEFHLVHVRVNAPSTSAGRSRAPLDDVEAQGGVRGGEEEVHRLRLVLGEEPRAHGHPGHTKGTYGTILKTIYCQYIPVVYYIFVLRMKTSTKRDFPASTFRLIT